jgi:hypothetical protein
MLRQFTKGQYDKIQLASITLKQQIPEPCLKIRLHNLCKPRFILLNVIWWIDFWPTVVALLFVDAFVLDDDLCLEEILKNRSL